MITYTFYGEPVSFNEYINAERTNKFRAAKIKKEETENIAHELMIQNAQPIKYKFDLHIKIYAKDKRRDPDSWVMFYKFLLDAMQLDEISIDSKNKINITPIIPNDSQLFVGAISQDAIYIDKLNPRIEVFITESV